MARLSRTLAAVAVLGAFCTVPAWAAQALTQQQQRMNYCNVLASSQGLQGNSRKSYLTSCVKGQSPTAAAAGKPLTPKQQRMANCDQQASTQRLGGEARMTFMKSCLRM